MRKIFLPCFFILNSCILFAQQTSNRIRFEHLTVADGLPENSVTCMLQDHLGFIWMGTQFGLVRYDGNKLTTFPYSHDNLYGFRGMHVGALFEDQYGDIWIGTENLVRFERSTQRFIQYPDKNSSEFGFEFIQFIHQDKKGFIWTARHIKDQNILSRFDPKRSAWAYFNSDQGNPHYIADNGLADINDGLAEDKDGKIWIVTNGQNENTLQLFDPNIDNFIPFHPKMSSAMAEDFKKIFRLSFSEQEILYVTPHYKGFFALNMRTGEVKQFRHQAKDPESLLSDTTIDAIHPDKKGLAWISTTKGLEKYDPQTSTLTHYIFKATDPSTPGAGWIYGFYETPRGDIWFGNYEPGNYEPWGMCFYQRNSNSFIRYKSDLKQEDALWGQIMSIFVDHNGMTWMGSFNNGLNKESRTNQFPLIKNMPGNTNSLQDDKVYLTFEDKSKPGIIWFGTGKGLDRYDKKTGRYIHYKHNNHNKKSISKGSVLSVAEDKNGRFWVGTDGGGLNLMDRKKGSFIHFVFDSSNTNSLGSFNNSVQSLTSASDGTLWVETDEGLNHFDYDKKKFTHYYIADSSYTPKLFELIRRYTSPDRIVAAIVHPTNNVNSTAGFDLSEPTDLLVTGMGQIRGTSNADYGWIEEARGGILWSMDYTNTLHDVNGRMRSGVLHLGKGSYFLRYKSDDRYSFGHWTGAAPLHSDLWGITVTRISFAEAEDFNKELTKREFNGLGDNNINSVIEDSKNKIWIGSNNGGVDHFDPATGKFESYEKRSTGPLSVTSIMEDRMTGNFWVGDYIFGLLLMNPKGKLLKTYNASNGLSCNSVIGIEIDPRGILWIATENGLCRFNPTSERFQLYNKKNGLQGLTFNSANSQTVDGEMYFGGDHGINAFYPSQIVLDTIAPLVVLTDLDINGRTATIAKDGQMSVHISVAKDIELPHNMNELTFHFTSLLYERGNESQFAYKLSPGDKDWVQSGGIRQAHYTNLNPGLYTFVVKACNADGVWNKTGVSINLVILPPWWKTLWANTIFGFLIIGAIWGLIYYRSQQLRKENLLLENKVARRTNQLNLSLEELKSTQAQLIQSEKMASLGELTAGIAHEIQNPLNFINNFSEVNAELIEEMKEDFKIGNQNDGFAIADNIAENERKISHHGKRADAIVKGMLQHSRFSAGVKEPTNVNDLADEYLRLSYHGFRAREKLFNVAMQTDYDQAIGNISIIPQDFGRVLLNLYNNAFYAVSEKKKQQLESYEPSVYVSTRKAGNQMEIRVKDNGNGIPHKVTDKIFQPFFTTKPTGQGTGLGLSLSYDIIKAHGGEIRVETEEGKFTEFVIQIPAV
jgi:signal transduction histidine kinase/ligand-binding sensor domain-containing protein